MSQSNPIPSPPAAAKGSQKQEASFRFFPNVRRMLAFAWQQGRSVLGMGLLLALVSVALQLVELFIAPQILLQVELARPLSDLLKTIFAFSLLLFVLLGSKEYLDKRSQWGRIALRSKLVMGLNKKTNTTSYPNTLDADILKLRGKAYDAVCGNSEPGEHVWTTLTTLLTNGLGFAIYLSLLTGLEPVLLLVVIGTTLASFLVSRHMDAWRYRNRSIEADLDKKFQYMEKQSSSIALAKDVRLFGLRPWLEELYDRLRLAQEAFLNKSARKVLVGHVVDVVLSLARNGLAYFYLLHLTLAQGLPASRFLLYFSAVSGFTNWMSGILNELSTLQKEDWALESVWDFLHLPEPFRFSGGIALPDLTRGAEIRLEGVSYQYPNSDTAILDQVSLTLHAGEKLAIVGLNGAGKTTLVKLIVGLLDPTQGRVLLNGIDIRRFNRQEYYGAFATVFQHFSVLDISVAENVAQVMEGADRDKVARCLDQAGLLEKVHSLPQGMDTNLGRTLWDDGTLLSGGETQRLMLARALYREAPLLVLDEPTAALDPLAENDLYLKYNEMTQGKTSIFVSHRLASTRFCDRILFIGDGGIAEEGSHEALLARGGRYAALYQVQSRYYQEGADF